MKRVALVVPTNRPENLASFLQAWSGLASVDDVVVVFDGPRSECTVETPNGVVFCWDDFETLYGKNHWIFSRKDSACRSFGFLQAVKRGADTVITLDDDCYPLSTAEAGGFIETHQRNLDHPPAWVSSIPGMRVRGIPYAQAQVEWLGPPVFVSMGLWCDVPDLGAVEALALGSALDGEFRSVLTRIRPTGGTRIMSPYQFFHCAG